VPTKLEVGRVWDKQCSPQNKEAADRMDRVKMRIYMVDFKEGQRRRTDAGSIMIKEPAGLFIR
jgi:hypothetical protein